jgi:hypothetical protein
MESGISWWAWVLAMSAIGGLLGLFFAFNGFGEPVKSTDLKDSTRVRNLIWVFTGAIGVLFADWGKLSGETAPKAGSLLIFYLLGAIGGTVVGLVMMIILIAWQIGKINQYRDPTTQLSATGLIMDYLSYGYAHYREMVEKASQQAVQAVKQRTLSRLGFEIEMRRTIADLINSVTTVLAEPEVTATRKRQVIEDILEGVTTAVQKQAHDQLKLRANYMEFLPIASANSKEKEAALFRFGDENRYTGLLVLKSPDYKSAEQTVVIPVDGQTKDRETLLPGAPEAFVLQRAEIQNCDSIKFRKGVETKTVDEIKKYFSDAEYKSFASIPIPGSSGSRGVINIESDHKDLLDEGEEVAKRVCETLRPFSVLLSKIM